MAAAAAATAAKASTTTAAKPSAATAAKPSAATSSKTQEKGGELPRASANAIIENAPYWLGVVRGVGYGGKEPEWFERGGEFSMFLHRWRAGAPQKSVDAEDGKGKVIPVELTMKENVVLPPNQATDAELRWYWQVQATGRCETFTRVLAYLLWLVSQHYRLELGQSPVVDFGVATVRLRSPYTAVRKTYSEGPPDPESGTVHRLVYVEYGLKGETETWYYDLSAAQYGYFQPADTSFRHRMPFLSFREVGLTKWGYKRLKLASFLDPIVRAEYVPQSPDDECGRDFYDIFYYLVRHLMVNLVHDQLKLTQVPLPTYHPLVEFEDEKTRARFYAGKPYRAGGRTRRRAAFESAIAMTSRRTESVRRTERPPPGRRARFSRPPREQRSSSRVAGRGRPGGTEVCLIDRWRSSIADRQSRGSGQLSLETCGPVNDGTTWQETAAAKALTLLDSIGADAAISAFESSACRKRSAFPPNTDEAYAANEAYMRDVHLTPADLHACSTDPKIMDDWKRSKEKPSTSLFGKNEPERAAFAACARKFSDVNALFGRCNPVDRTVLEPAERDWLRMEVPLRFGSDTMKYDALSWQTREEMTVVSPAQNFAVSFPQVTDAKQLWIKGSKYSVPSLLGSAVYERFPAADAVTTFVFRLTPRQYHRFHVPVTGELVGLIFLGSRHLSVQPALLQDTNVLTENVRVVLLIKTAMFGTVAMVIVGATCVFSIELSHPDPQQQTRLRDLLALAISKPGVLFGPVGDDKPVLLRKRQQLGRFIYGSTIVLLLPRTPLTGTSTHLREASHARIETELRVGQPVAFSNQPFSAAQIPTLLQRSDAGRQQLDPQSFQLCP